MNLRASSTTFSVSFFALFLVCVSSVAIGATNTTTNTTTVDPIGFDVKLVGSKILSHQYAEYICPKVCKPDTLSPGYTAAVNGNGLLNCSPKVAPSIYTGYTIVAGPYSKSEASQYCPEALDKMAWNGHWYDYPEPKGSVCGCQPPSYEVPKPVVTGVNETTVRPGDSVVISGSQFPTTASYTNVQLNTVNITPSAATADTLTLQLPDNVTSGNLKVFAYGVSEAEDEPGVIVSNDTCIKKSSFSTSLVSPYISAFLPASDNDGGKLILTDYPPQANKNPMMVYDVTSKALLRTIDTHSSATIYSALDAVNGIIYFIASDNETLYGVDVDSGETVYQLTLDALNTGSQTELFSKKYLFIDEDIILVADQYSQKLVTLTLSSNGLVASNTITFAGRPTDAKISTETNQLYIKQKIPNQPRIINKWDHTYNQLTAVNYSEGKSADVEGAIYLSGFNVNDAKGELYISKPSKTIKIYDTSTNTKKADAPNVPLSSGFAFSADSNNIFPVTGDSAWVLEPDKEEGYKVNGTIPMPKDASHFTSMNALVAALSTSTNTKDNFITIFDSRVNNKFQTFAYGGLMNSMASYINAAGRGMVFATNQSHNHVHLIECALDPSVTSD